MEFLLKSRMVATDPKSVPASEPLISVIIPTWNEADSLGEVITAVQSADVSFEILVVDAGSTDNTATIAFAAGAKVLHSFRRQRAYQLNLGAQHARGAVLLFLHADTVLPPHALEAIVGALENRVVVGGAFARRYACRSIVLRATCFLAQWRNQLIGWHLGDQAMFVRCASFFQVGGFREVTRFEDLDLSRRLRRFGRTLTLRPSVTSSPRRFDRLGPARTTLRDLTLTVRYLIQGLPESDAAASLQAAPTYARTKRVGNL